MLKTIGRAYIRDDGTRHIIHDLSESSKKAFADFVRKHNKARIVCYYMTEEEEKTLLLAMEDHQERLNCYYMTEEEEKTLLLAMEDHQERLKQLAEGDRSPRWGLPGGEPKRIEGGDKDE